MFSSLASPPLPKIYWVLWWGTIVNRLGTVIVPFLTFYLTQDRGLDAGTAGVVVALWGVGAALAGTVGGVIADHYGRRPAMLFSLVGGAIVISAFAFVERIEFIGFLAFLLGLVAESYRPAVMATIADVVPAKDRPRAYGLIYWAVNIGFAISAGAGGFLVRLGYEALFILDAGTTLLYAFVVYRLVPETRPDSTASQSSVVEPPSGLADVFRDRLYMAFIGLSLLVGIVFLQSSASMAADMSQQGFDETDYGMVMALNGLLIVFVQPWAVGVVPRFGAAAVLAVAAALTGAGFGVYAFADTLVVWGVGVLVWTAGEIAMSPVNSTLVASFAPIAMRGRYQGVWSMSHGVAATLGPYLGTQILDLAGRNWLWGGTAALGVVAALGFACLGHPIRTRMAAASA